MKKIIFKISVMAVLAMIICPTLSVFAADEGYTLLAPLPGLSETLKTDNILGTYVPAIFKLAIGLSAVAAVLMIVIGGFQYLSSDAVMQKSAGKERIKNAVFGLVLVISAWLILNTINPNLLNINLNLESITTTDSSGGTLGTSSKKGVSMTEAEVTASNAIRSALKIGNVDVYAGPCISGDPIGCVNLNGLKTQTSHSVLSLKKACGVDCAVVITGGTEAAHSDGSAHYTGDALDLKTDNSKLNDYIIKNGGTPEQNSLGPRYTLNIDGRNVYFLRESNPPHWHMSIIKK